MIVDITLQICMAALLAGTTIVVLMRIYLEVCRTCKKIAKVLWS